MKRFLCILGLGLVLAAAALLFARSLKAQKYQKCLYRTNQPPEAQALMSQEWARAHARPMR